MSYIFDLRNRKEIYWVEFKILNVFDWIFSHFYRPFSPKGQQISYIKFLFHFKTVWLRQVASLPFFILPTPQNVIAYAEGWGVLACLLVWSGSAATCFRKRGPKFSWIRICLEFPNIALTHIPQLAKQMRYSKIIQCIKLCVFTYTYSQNTTICQIVLICNKQHYVIYNNYMFRPCKRAIIRLFTEPSSRLNFIHCITGSTQRGWHTLRVVF